jgi:hypothetical protein
MDFRVPRLGEGPPNPPRTARAPSVAVLPQVPEDDARLLELIREERRVEFFTEAVLDFRP